MPDLDALAASLAETAANLDAHIERRAREIAQPRVEQQRAESARFVAEQRAEMESMRERKDDLIAELRRQLNAAVKNGERLHRENKAAREAIKRVESLRVWVNEDRKGFLFAEDVWAALGDVGSVATRYLASVDHGNQEEVAGLLGEMGGGS